MDDKEHDLFLYTLVILDNNVDDGRSLKIACGTCSLSNTLDCLGLKCDILPQKKFKFC